MASAAAPHDRSNRCRPHLRISQCGSSGVPGRRPL